MMEQNQNKIVKLLPSYVGSKSYWLKDLECLKGMDIAELFCGSSIISANLASKAYLNDSDPYIHKILTHYKDLVEVDCFTSDDYYRCRELKDWWKYSYYLQKMSFSGVFRYSKNGFNVAKKPIERVEILDELMKAKFRMKELNPKITNLNYLDPKIEDYNGYAVIMDPPYEGSNAAYNKKFNYSDYWDFIQFIKERANPLVIFDRQCNINKHFPQYEPKLRMMRVNGKCKGDVEAMIIYDNPEYMKKKSFAFGKGVA
jgi:site-specific DNA-adenine methylase